MRRPRFKFLRFMALAAMILSMSGVLGLTASAAPDTQNRPAPSAGQDLLNVELCLQLEAAAIVDASGLFTGNPDPVLLLDILLGLDLDVDVLDLVLANAIIGDGCALYLPVPAPEPTTTTAFVNIEPAVPANYQVYSLGTGTVVAGGFHDFSTGAVAIGQLPAGDYTLSVDAPGYQFVQNTVPVSGEYYTLYAAVTPVDAPAPTVTTTFINIEPDVPANYQVYSLGTGTVVAGGYIDFGTGDLAIGDLPVGDYVLDVDAEGFEFYQNTFTVSGEYYTIYAELTAAPVEDLTTTYLNVEPNVAANYQIYSLATDSVVETGFFDFSTGDVVIGDLAPGDYVVSVEAEGFQPYQNTQTVSGEAYTLYAELTPIEIPTFSVFGYVVEVVDGEYVPVPGALVRALSADGTEEFGSATADDTGYFEIAGLEAGNYYLPATAEGYELGGGSITIIDEDVEVAFALTPSEADTHTLSGVVTDEETGEPIEGATVTVNSDDDFSILAVIGSAVTDADGIYSIEIPDGTFTVTATADGYIADSQDVTIDEADAELDFALVPGVELTTTYLNVEPDVVANYQIYDLTNNVVVVTGYHDFSTGDALIGDLAPGDYVVSVDAEGYEFYQNTQTVSGEAYTLYAELTEAEPETYNVWVNVDPDVTAYFTLYNSDGEIVGEGQPFDFATGDAYIGTLADGTYTLLVEAEGFNPYENDFVVDGSDLTMYALLTPSEAGLSTISGEVVDAETGEPIEGALIEIVNDEDDLDDDFSIQALVATTYTDANGQYSVDVPNGTYAVVASATGYEVDYQLVTVDDADEVVNFALATVTTGWLAIDKLYCEDATAVSFNAGVADDDCEFGSAFFTVYQYGDGTADYIEFPVWESGFGLLELEPGLYDLVEEGTDAKFTFEVALGEVTFIEVVNPGVAPAPRDGTVNISVFACSNITETVFNHDGYVAVYAAGLPTFEPACEPGTATLTFYLVGDGTADYEQITVNGAGSIELAPGTYEVVEEGTQARTFITVYAGDIVNLDVQIPTGEYEPGSSVNIAKFYCDTVTEVEWLSLGWSEYSDRDEPWGAPDCTPGAATFTFYLYGDGTADYAQIRVNGAGSIGLEPGLYEVVEEETQARFDLEVLEGENTILIVNNPMPEDGHVPGGPDDDGDGHPHKPGKDKHHKHHHHKHGKDTSSTEVSKLPSTGAGSSESTDALAMAVAAAAALAGAGALRLRKDS